MTTEELKAVVALALKPYPARNITASTLQGVFDQVIEEHAQQIANIDTGITSLAGTAEFLTNQTAEAFFGGNVWELKSGAITTATAGYNTMMAKGAGNTHYERAYDSTCNLKWFDPDPTGTRDSSAAFEKAFAYLLKRTTGILGHGVRGTLYVPAGVYLISRRIVVPDKIKMFGENARSTEIRPMPGYTDTYMVELSNKDAPGGRVNVFSTMVSYISFDLGGIPTLSGGYSQEANEHCGFEYCCFKNICYRGVVIEAPKDEGGAFTNPGWGPQNFTLKNLEFIFMTGDNATSRGIVLDLNAANFQGLRDISIVGKNALGIGIQIDWAAGWYCHNIHFENVDRGFSLADHGPCFSFAITGVNVQNTVHATVYMRGTVDTNGYFLSAIRSSAGFLAIQDFRNQPTGRTNISGPIGFYSVSGEAFGQRNIRCSRPTYDKYFLAVYGDVAAATTAGMKQGEMFRRGDGVLMVIP